MQASQFSAARYYVSAYLPVAVTVSYLPIWLNEKGFGDNQIGLMNTLPMAGLLLMSVFVGRLADRAPDWKRAIVIGQGAAFFFSLLLALAGDYWQILGVWTLTILSAGLVTPVADAATLRMSLRRGFSFGATRAWGTVGYLSMCFLTGYIVLATGPNGFVWLFAFGALARWISAMLLPPLRDAGTRRPVRKGGVLLSRELLSALPAWVLLPMVASALLFGNHMVMNAFSALVWKQQGISETMIGVLIGIGGIAEASTMFAWSRINARFPARLLILTGGLASVLRWSGMAFELPLPAIFVLQIGQALTFSLTFLGCLYFIAKRTDEETAAEAQSLFGVMQQGASILIVTLFGLAYSLWGIDAFWTMVVLSLTAIAMLLASLRMHGTDPTG